jgi:hypothetical protein
MKKCIMIWGLLAVAVLAKADTGFLKTVPADDFAAAGLQKLTPEELSRLEALVQRYKTGEMTDVRQQEEARALATQQEAEKKIVAAEAKAKEAEMKANEAETKARDAEAKSKAAEAKANEIAQNTKEVATKAPAAPGKKQPGWFTALITLNRAGEKPEKEEPLESRLVGDFDGWNGRSMFSLENGTRWVQQNKTDTYVYSPTLHSPKVKIKPAAIRGFWLEIEGVNLQVRVMPFALPEQK